MSEGYSLQQMGSLLPSSHSEVTQCSSVPSEIPLRPVYSPYGVSFSWAGVFKTDEADSPYGLLSS